MAASGEDVVGGEVEVHEDIDELVSETVRKYSVLYDKTLKTTVVVGVVVTLRSWRYCVVVE